MQRFYVNLDIQVGTKIALPANVVLHLNVVRINKDQEIILFNGNGYSYLAKLIEIERKMATTLILEQITINTENKVPISLALSLISNDKMDLAIQKATELGVNTLIPLISEYSQRINHERLIKRQEHWQNIIISSCEQCGGNIMPQLLPLTQFKHFIVDGTKSELNLILSPRGNRHNLTKSSFKSINLVVGPEGGFTPDEVNLAEKHNYLDLALGARIMRAETAIIAGISFIKTITGDF